jgi:hypothetical protein
MDIRLGVSVGCPQPPIAAAFSNLNNLNATGLYPVLFNAVIDLATALDASTESVFDKARARIIAVITKSAAGLENRSIWGGFMAAGLALAPGLVLRTA